MTSSRNMLLMLLLVASASLLQLEAKTVFRRTDKISENFKQLDLPPEEIDPNVAPPESEPPKVEDVADEVSAAVADAVTPASLIDESANEIASGDVETPNAVAPVPEAAAAAASEAAVPAEAAAPAVATTLAAKPTKAPTTAKPENPISKFCKCSETHCDCCRKFGLPLLPSGPGCAKIAYLGNDEMSVSLKYGDITLASRRISSKRARPICVGLPGGYSQFCGKVYGLSRAKDSKDFKACLAFELRADDEVEASLRVSCFKFGPEGLRVAEAEPLPAKPSSDDDDDDDDDLFGFAAGGDDDEDEEDDYDSDNDADTDDDDDTEDYADDDEAEAPEEADYGGFSLAGLLDELDDDEDEKPVKKPAAVDQTREHVSVDGQTTSTSTSTTTNTEGQVQSKDDSEAPAAGEAAAAVAAVAPVEGEVVTPSPASAADDSTTPKSKKSKKAKKNKKKKAAAEATDETGFAYELLNGILDFFN
ncbi:nucleolar protein dao-5 [Drosophila takahashii]|uniref:nucleolar protein dao-5 n=1 Tax=Drosophila takahashii TaxID=29030 RepID=UPI0038993F87